MYKAAGITDVGMVKEINEDYFICDVENEIMIVADGVSGHRHGEVASEEAAKSCHRHLTEGTRLQDAEDIPEVLTDSISYANVQVLERKKNHAEESNMGTTLSCAYVKNQMLSYAWVGDSRIYLIDRPAAEIRQLSVDHTVYQEMLDRGIPTDKYKQHILTRMVGSNLYVTPQGGAVHIRKGDYVLLCSDGLSDLVSNDFLLRTVLGNNEDLEASLRALVANANGQGGRDNITAILAAIF